MPNYNFCNAAYSFGVMQLVEYKLILAALMQRFMHANHHYPSAVGREEKREGGEQLKLILAALMQ